MTVTCPYCRVPVAVDSAGNSACGHLRGGPGAPAPPPAAPVVPPPAAPAPPPVAYGAGQGWTATPPPKRGGGCGKTLGCLLAAGAIVVVAVVGIMLLPDTLPDGTQPGAPSSGAPGVPGGASANPAALAALPPPTRPLTGTITVGEGEPVLQANVKAGKAVILTPPDAGPDAAFAIDIPAGAFPDRRTIQVSAAPLEASGFDGAVTPASLLYTIDTGGGYAAAPIEVTIPVDLAPGEFALGFYLRDDGTLEALPLVAEDEGSITVATRHFSSIFASKIALDRLPEEIGTGFRAGEDDFPTPNYGTYLEPDGHCAGQSLAELWYFENRKATGGPPLFTRGDHDGTAITPKFDYDDRLAYRLSSEVQHNLDFDTFSAKIERFFHRLKGADRLQLFAARYAMYVTGQPQYLGLYRSNAGGGHAIVVYASTAYGLWVADPNRPGELMSVDWDAAASAFKPYVSGSDAKSKKRPYDQIGFYGRSAFFDFAQVGAAWAKAEAGKAGDGLYPAYTLKAAIVRPDLSGQDWLPLADGLVIPGDSVVIELEVPSGADLVVTQFNEQSPGVWARIKGSSFMTVHLGPGVNHLTFLVEGNPDNNDDELVDWVEVTVTSGPAPTATAPPPAPDPTPGPSVDCSKEPDGGQIEWLQWALACEEIGTFVPTP